ncbi:Maf-like protein [Actinidia chinensis var. chinensis]|uniref:Maf-like protein n=1 Tax=Actinidia chinensis var. chinensis TaxID=1590841 RepID=A0A2R6QXW7_ACTCC|nr:Maf-like protein [Actinidia chinensis var. chinensis]
MEATTSQFKIILGSSSVARRKILAEMGYDFKIMTADIDEKSIRKETPEELVMALAEAKADAIRLKLQTIDNQEKDVKPTLLIAADTAEAIIPKLPSGDCKEDAEPSILITCDQVVVYEGMVREKPSSEEEARQFLKGYSGGSAATVSSVLVANLKTGVRKGDWDRVEIHFHAFPDEVIDKLIEEGFVLNVAGGLIIEHPLILPYVKQVVGTTDSVMGLPKALTERLIKEAL